MYDIEHDCIGVLHRCIAYANVKHQTNEGRASLSKLKVHPLEVSTNVQKLIVARCTAAWVDKQDVILY